MEPPWSGSPSCRAMCLSCLWSLFCPSRQWTLGQCGQQSASCRPSVGAGFYLQLNISQAPRLAAVCRVINSHRNNIRLRLTADVCQVYTILHHLQRSGCQQFMRCSLVRPLQSQRQETGRFYFICPSPPTEARLESAATALCAYSAAALLQIDIFTATV